MSRSGSAQREPKPSPARSRATPDVDLARLESLPFAEIRQLWLAHGGRAKSERGRSVQRRIMVREIAYRVQSRRAGGMDKATTRLLKQAVRAVLDGREMSSSTEATKRGVRDRLERSTSTDVDPAAPRSSSSPCLPDRPLQSARHSCRASTTTASVPLPVGARLVRTWRGRTHEVTVVEDGKAFNYKGKTYRSLSKIAREITGTVWSGPRFFGIAKAASRGGKRSAGTQKERGL